MRHETIEKSAGLLGVLTAVAISLGGLAEIVPLIMSRDAPTRSAMSASASSIGRPRRVSVSTRLNSLLAGG